MPTRTLSLYARLVSIGSPLGTLTLQDADDGFFEALGDETGNNQAAFLDGTSVTVNSIRIGLSPTLVVALVDGVSVQLQIAPIRIVIEDGLIDDVYIAFPGLPVGAQIVSVSLPLFSSEYDFPLCLAAETPVETPSGYRPAGKIRPGDRVSTMDNGPQEVLWVGRRSIDFRTSPANREHVPVVIERGALGANRPRTRIRVSPLHRVLVSHWKAALYFAQHEVLVFAKSLIDGKAVWEDNTCDSIDYVHLLFSRHEIIFAAGAAVESLHPGDTALTSMDEQARSEVLAIFPDLAFGEGCPTSRMALKHSEGKLLRKTAG